MMKSDYAAFVHVTSVGQGGPDGQRNVHSVTARHVALACFVVIISLRSTYTKAAELPDDYKLPPAPGPYATTGEVNPSFTSGQPLIATSYFYWYDASTKQHIVNADGSDALTDHPTELKGMSYRDPSWHAGELSDMIDAGIDVALPVYWGTPGDPQSWSDVGVEKLVEGRDQLVRAGKRPPKIGMFYDTSTLRHNPGRFHIDLRTSAGRLWFYGTIRNFFSHIPGKHRACIDGKPLVFLYAPAFAKGVDDTLFPELRQRFRADFGTDLYLVKMRGWPGPADSVYMWGGALQPQYLDVAAIGPGYDHSAVPGRSPLVRDREEGIFYTRGWERLLASPAAWRPWLVHVETWNELHEGTEVCETKEYGREYIQLTRRFADSFHIRRRVPPEHLPKPLELATGSPGKSAGIDIFPFPEGDGPVVEKEIAGQTAWCAMANANSPNRYLYFRVDDNFLYLGEPSIELSICYYDDGPKQFIVEYDSKDPKLSGLSRRFRPGHRQTINGSRQWKEITVVLPYPLFAGGANGGDLRIACVDEELAVRSIKLRHLDAN